MVQNNKIFQLILNLFKKFYFFICIYFMNNLRMTAMKSAKNQFSAHASITPTFHSDCNNEEQVQKCIRNKNLFKPHKVELQNSKVLEVLEFDKSKNTLKHKISSPYFESIPVSSHSYAFFCSQNKQSYDSSRAPLIQYHKLRKTLVPNELDESEQFCHSNSCQDIYNTENSCSIKTQGNKIIINPKNNHILFSQSSRNSLAYQDIFHLQANESCEDRHNFSQASTDYTKQQNKRCKQSTKDLQYQKYMRSKKTVFKTPAFLKNKNIVVAQEANYKKSVQKKPNNSIPKDFKTTENIFHPRDAGLHRYLQQKAQNRAHKNKHGRISCVSSEKNIRSHLQHKNHINLMKPTNTIQEQYNTGTFPAGKQVSLRIVSSQRRFLYANLKILKVLAQNDATSVYLVVQKNTGFLYCLKKTEIKIIDEINSKNSKKISNTLQNLIRQSKIGTTLDHPFLIKTYCTLYDKKNIYQLMEFVEGSTLQNLNKQIKKNSVRQQKTVHSILAIKEILTQLLEAIKYLHDRKIAHRDLKPANIFISNNHAFKIGDFGCSIYSEPKDFVGTLDYVAPEIMLHDSHGTPVDMWAIGCIAFELYIGYPPFYHPKRKQTIQNIIQCKTELKIIEDAKLRDFIYKLLLKLPQKRMTAKQAFQHPFIKQNAQKKGY